MADDVDEDEALAQPLADVGVKPGCLAGGAAEEDEEACFEIALHLAEDACQVALHVLAAFELIALLLGGGSLVAYAEVVLVACSVDDASLLEDVVGEGDEGGSAA